MEEADRLLEASRERLLECIEVKALSLLILGRLDEARVSLTELFERSPDYAIRDPSLTPAQRENIETLRETVRPLSARVGARWLTRESIRVDVVLEGGMRDAARLRFLLATAPEIVETAIELPLLGRSSTATVAIATDHEVASVRISGRVTSAVDRLLHQFTSDILLANRPASLDPSEAGSDASSWLLWAGLGTGAVVAAVAIGLLARPGLPDASGTLGRLPVDP